MTETGHLPFDPIAEAMRHWRGHGWEGAVRGMGVVTSVIRVEQILAGRAEAEVRPLGLTFARYEVLMLLLFSKHGELPLGKIGERLQVAPGSVTNAVDPARAGPPRPPAGEPRRRTWGSRRHHAAAGATWHWRPRRALNDSLFSASGAVPSDTDTLFRLLGKLRQRAGDFD